MLIPRAQFVRFS